MALPAPAVGPDRVGQGTAIEQSRAVAQVQAAVIIARQYPRDVQAAIRAMVEACARPSLANSAFYQYPRGKEIVTGPTIKLAQEIACIWGNVDFGLAELRMDPIAGESEMLAYAWDLQSNARFSQIVIVQHVRDKTVGGQKVAERLADQRDIYELNTNNAARRLRECIRRVVPTWFFEDAEARCRATIENPGDGLTLAQRIARVVRGFENGFGIELPRLEVKVGKKVANWTAWDVGQLTITGDSLKLGTITVADAFPVDVVTPTEITNRQPATKPVDAIPTSDPQPTVHRVELVMVTKPQLARIHAALANCKVTEAERHTTLGMLIGRTITSASQLTLAEAGQIIDALDRCASQDEPDRALDAYLANLDQAPEVTG
jgi:hypothetical protein